MGLAAWWNALLPGGVCVLCALPCRAPLCEPCLDARMGARRRCARCALPLAPPPAPTDAPPPASTDASTDASRLCPACLRAPPAWRHAIALGDYAPPLDRLVRRLKFGADPMLGRWLGGLLGQAWTASGLAAPALVVPVPLSAARLDQRGYNQAWEVGRGLAAALRRRGDPGLLLRRRDTAPQSSLPLHQRARNVRGAFAAARALRG